MRNVDQIVIFYPGMTSSARIKQPANYSFSRLLLRLKEIDDVPIYFLNQSRRSETYGPIEFIHFSPWNLLRLLPRLFSNGNTLIISQLHRYRRYATMLRAMLPNSRLLVRLGGVYNGAAHLKSDAFAREARGDLRYLRSVDMVLSTADGTPVDLFMQRVGVTASRYRKWPNGFPVIENTSSCVRSDQILCIARLSREKAVDYVLDAYAVALPNLSRAHDLLIVGDGPEKARLREQAERLGIAQFVTFTGESFDVADYLYSSKLLVTGLANNTVMEAIATNTPVITVDLGEMKELYGAYPNVHIIDYPPGGYGSIEPAHRDRVVADTARKIVSILSDEATGTVAGFEIPLYSWDERLNSELELYDSLFEMPE